MIRRPSLLSRWPVALAVAVALAACGGGGDKSPTSSTPPSPVPAPTPTPTPVPTPSPLGTGCGSVPKIADGTEKCRKEISEFFPAVDAAIEQVIREKPHIFNFNDQRGAGGYRLVREAEFVYSVMKNLEAQGLCTGLYAEELAVKKNDDYSENFDTVLATGHVRRGENSYASTCYPASFSYLPVVPPASPEGCSLPPSGEIWCARERQSWLQLVDDAIEQTTRDHPEWFDFRDLQPGTPWFKVLETDAYIQHVVGIMRSKGFCAKQDRDEINLKMTNDSSENYDILTWQQYVRRGEGSYIVTCWPAQF